MRVVDKLDKLGRASAVAELLRRRGRADAGAGRRSAWQLAAIRVADTSFVERVRALGVERRAARRGARRAGRGGRGLRVGARRPGQVVADLRIARGLDYYTGTVFEICMAATSTSGRSAAAAATTRWPPTAGRPTRASASRFGVSRMLVPAARPRRARRRAGRCRAPCWSRSPTRSPRGPSDAVAAALRARGIAVRGRRRRRRSSASRSGTPSGAASRSSGSRPADGAADEVKDIRSGDQVAADPGTWTPPAEDLRPQVIRTDHARHRGAAPVIRTHDAGTLRAEHVGQTVTLAGWVARRRDHGGVAFLDLRDASGVVQVVVRDEAVAHSLRNEYCLKVTGEVAPRPEGNANPNLPTGEIEVIADRRSRCSARPRRCRSRSTTTSRWGRRRGSSYRYLDLRRPGPGAALRLRSEVNRAARDVLARARLRRDRDPDADPLDARGRPRLPGAGPAAAGQLVRPAAEPAAVQAAADGRRHGALLPDRPLLPRRGLPRRPAAGVHPARHRDELRRAGRRHRARPRRCCGALWRLVGHDVAHADPADDLRRGDGPLRLRQARPAVRASSSSSAPSTSRTRRSGCSRRRTSARW